MHPVEMKLLRLCSVSLEANQFSHCLNIFLRGSIDSQEISFKGDTPRAVKPLLRVRTLAREEQESFTFLLVSCPVPHSPVICLPAVGSQGALWISRMLTAFDFDLWVLRWQDDSVTGPLPPMPFSKRYLNTLAQRATITHLFAHETDD